MLKVEFKQIENVVLMKVIEQGNEIKLGCGCFFEHNGIKLRSVDCPQICSSSLYVKGESDDVQDVYTSKSFNTPEEASEHIAKFTECIDAYNDSVREKDLLWKPNINDEYYRISSNYEHAPCLCYYWGAPYDEKIVKNFGAFKSKEQAEKVRNHIILMNLLWQLKFALCPDYEFNKESQHNSFIHFNRQSEMFDYAFVSGTYDFATPVFDDKSVERAVEYLNSHKELWGNLL